MKVQELVKNINNTNFNLVDELNIKKYIPMIDKKKFVMDVIAACTDYIDDFITVDKFKMHVYFNMRFIALYTNLETSDVYDEMIEQYDELMESNVFKSVVELCNDEYILMKNILDDELDVLLIQNSIDAQVVKVANKINRVLDLLSDKIGEIDLATLLPEGMDIGELIQMIKILK